MKELTRGGLILLLLAIVAAGAFAGGKAEAPKAEKGKIVVGATLQDLSNEYIAMLKDAMVKRQKDKYPDVELIINDAEGDAQKQDSQMHSFISQKVNAIIVCPRDANAIVPSIEAAVAADIPVVCLSAVAAEEVGQVSITSENADGGELEMQHVADKIGGKGNIAILRGPLGASAEIGRYNGYKRVLDKYPNIKVVFDQTGNWSREQGMAIMENWLQTGVKLDAVVAQNDEMILGALMAAEAAGVKDKIFMSGLDGIPDAFQAVEDGRLDATLLQDSIGQAYGSVDMAVQAARGEPVEDANIPFELVTKENVAEYWDRIKM
jgi:inositol transport system substrate-binding protein